MRYFVMNGGYQWVEVVKRDYDNVPANMINNKASIDPDAFVSISIANVGLDGLKDLFVLLQETWNQGRLR